MWRLFLYAAAISLATSGCGEAERVSESAPTTTTGTPLLAPTSSLLAPDTSVSNFAERDGDLYLYVSAVSEEDREKGRAIGDVLMFRYLGKVEGNHVLESVGDAGEVYSRAECSDQCRVIKRTARGVVDRLPYEPSSVIGSAFEDAIAGRLRAVATAKPLAKPPPPSPAAATPPSAIPAAFLGEWNERTEDCGTGLNDSRLRVEASVVRFYESDAFVKDVIVRNPRAVTIVASFSGEGQTWANSFEMTLSGSGDDLTIGDLTRHRCGKAANED